MEKRSHYSVHSYCKGEGAEPGKYQRVHRNEAWEDHNARKKKVFPFTAAFDSFHSQTQQSYTCFLLGRDLIAEPVKNFLRTSDCALLDI